MVKWWCVSSHNYIQLKIFVSLMLVSVFHVDLFIQRSLIITCSLQASVAELKEKHRAELAAQKKKLEDAREKEGTFLKKCCQEADDELDEEKEKHKQSVSKIHELEVSGGYKAIK